MSTLQNTRTALLLAYMIEKLAFATAPLTLGVLLSKMGYVQGLPRTAAQPQSALLAIAMATIPAITNSLQVLLAFRLKAALRREFRQPSCG